MCGSRGVLAHVSVAPDAQANEMERCWRQLVAQFEYGAVAPTFVVDAHRAS
jgi:hypothetical protein